MLILRTLAGGPQHGWGISRWLQAASHEVLRVHQGSLYPALHRLERQGVGRAEWLPSEFNRRAKYYSLTPVGRRRLEAEAKDWSRFVEAVHFVMQAG
ncbi:MAG: PadR family transcriptional regulator [Gemmatimonadales bacterium]|nr:PadR family transcriptional regulator [Gemmatimonadales bacterium]